MHSTLQASPSTGVETMNPHPELSSLAEDLSTVILMVDKNASSAQRLAQQKMQLCQTTHRVNLVDFFFQSIKEDQEAAPGKSSQSPFVMVEFGCGQGETTTVLAHYVGDNGKVIGVDPAPGTYGGPWTLDEATAHLKASRLGSRMEFAINTDPLKFSYPKDLPSPLATVFVHASWYLNTPDLLSKLLEKAADLGSKYLCFAEYSTVPSGVYDVPHLLSILTQAQFQAHAQNSDANIRSLFTERQVKKIAEAAGWDLFAHTDVPSKNLDDGKWEVGHVLSSKFQRQVQETFSDDAATLLSLSTMIEATACAAEKAKALAQQDGKVTAPLQTLTTYAFVARRRT